MKRSIYLWSILALTILPLPAAHAAGPEASAVSKPQAVKAYGHLPLSFEANQGQTDQHVKFLSHSSGYSLFLTGDEAVLALKKPVAGTARDRQGKPAVPSAEPPAVVRMKLVGANAAAKVTGLGEQPGKSNYFIGNDPKKWRTNVPNYAKVKFTSVYPGVDLVYYGNQGQLEYDFVVQPGADPKAIKLGFAGDVTGEQATPLRIDGKGDLVLGTDGGEVVFHKPVVYQPRADRGRRTTDIVDGKYLLKGGRVAFEVGSYDKTRPLVIDPTLAYSTYLGGTNQDYGSAIAVDASGNAYVIGSTASSDFPVTSGAFQTTFGALGDAFVSKLNGAGSALVYSTFLGGTKGPPNDVLTVGHAIAVDPSGNVYVTGLTTSSNFPTTPGAFQMGAPGNPDAFLSKLNANGSALVYSTYLGGSGYDEAFGIALDASGNAYVTGSTGSRDFPTTPGAFQTTFGGEVADAFVSKLNAAGSGLLYSTYLRGSCGPPGGITGFNVASGIAVDASGDAYVTGQTGCSDFPTTPGAFEPSLPSGNFVSKLNVAGSGLLYSTYLGAIGEIGLPGGIALDASGSAYVTGWTDSSNFPTTPGALQTTFGGGNFDGFVSKLNAAGSGLLYSTYLGGSGDDGGSAITIDASGNAYVTGQTLSSDFPITPGAFQITYGGGGDAFVSRLNAVGSGLVYSTYLGGSQVEDFNGIAGIAVDALGDAYVTGATSSTNFPITPGAFQTTLGGGSEAFVSKFSFGDAVTLTPASLTFAAQGVGTYSPVQSATMKNTSGAALNIAHIYWPTGDYYSAHNCPTTLAPNASCTLKVTFTPTSPGARAGAVTISDNAPGSPQKLSLSGTGSGTGSIILKLSPASLSFGSVAVGTTSSPQTVTVTNVGSVAANFSSPFTFETGGKDCGDFHKNPQCGTNLAPNASCEVTLTFQPKASGTRTGIFVVHQGAHTRSIPLGGTGTP